MIPQDLEDLFADAMQTERKSPSRPMRNAKPEPVRVIQTAEKYSLPEYWVAGRVLALIHERTQTALGSFQEYTHRTEKGARKLLRLEGPSSLPPSIEYVREDAWLGTRREVILDPQTWTAKREITLPDLFLYAFGVHGEAVEVEVLLKFGGIYRVELRDHTTFHSPDAGVALTLPAGTNVYEVMDLQAKVELRKELST